MRESIEVRLPKDDEWVDGTLTTDNQEQVPRVIVDGRPYGPDGVAGVRGVIEGKKTQWLLKRAKEAGFKVEP